MQSGPGAGFDKIQCINFFEQQIRFEQLVWGNDSRAVSLMTPALFRDKSSSSFDWSFVVRAISARAVSPSVLTIKVTSIDISGPLFH